MKPLYGGGAVIAATILAGSFLLSAKQSIAETLLSSFQKPKQELSQDSKAGPARPDVAADSTNETSTNPVESDSKTTKAAAAKTNTDNVAVVTLASDPAGVLASSPKPVTAAATYTATAYSLRGRTASGTHVSKGLIAADPRLLPLGTRVRLEAGTYSGEYLVADTGGAVRGKKIDIWTPNNREAFRFGRRLVKLTVISYPAKRATALRRRKK